MKTIIAGSRYVTDFSIVESVINESGFIITEVVSGGASGVDSYMIQIARDKGLKVFVKEI